MRILFLDDDRMRHLKVSNWPGFHDIIIHAYTSADFKEAIQHSPKFDLIYMDHDLNMFEFKSKHQGPYGMIETTGFDLARWLVEEAPKEKWPDRIVVHSLNPAGGPMMRDLLQASGISTTWELFNA